LSLPLESYTDVAKTVKNVTKVGTIKMLPANVLAWKMVYSREFFQPPEYNLSEIGRVEDVESFVRQAIRKKTGLMFKAGFSITGPNIQTIQYIERRFAQIEQAQGKAMEILLREIGTDLLKYHNAYLVKVRNQAASGGLKRRDFRWGKTLQPVAAYFRMTPETVNIKRDIFGNVLQYRQQTFGGFKRLFFEPEDVIHFYVDRKGGFSVGTPALVPVMDDIRALRRLEENVELLIYQHLFPLLHYQVGTPDQPAETYPDGRSEIDIVREQIEMMPAEGSIVTPERHKISIIGAEGRALRADWYLNHFKQRVFAGLGMSAMDFGEGGTANRSTAERLSRSLVDDVKDYQGILSTFINNEIIRELLLESTWGLESIEPENLVKFVFSEIDEDSRAKKGAHLTNLYQGHLITETEARREMGYQPFTEEDRKDTYFELIEKPKAIIQAKLDAWRSGASPEALSKADPSTAVISPKAAAKPSTPAGRKAANITQPTNQHGKKTGPERRLSKEGRDADLQANGVKTAVNLYTMYLTNATDTVIRENKVNQDWLRQLAYLTANRLNRSYFAILQNSFYQGLNKASLQSDPQILVAFNDLQRNCEQHVDHMLRNAERTIVAIFNRHDDVTERQIQLRRLTSSLEHRARFFHDLVARRAYLWGKAHALKMAGYRTLEVFPGEDKAGCQVCASRAAQLVDTQHMTLFDIPPYHSSCLCDLQPHQE